MSFRKPWTVCAFLLVAMLPAGLAHTNSPLVGVPKEYCENLAGDTSVHEYALSSRAPPVILGFLDGALPDCDNDPLSTGDGHAEASLGGAFILAGEWLAPWAGATACFGKPADHPEMPTITVQDAGQATVEFIVAVDSIDPIMGVSTPTCGDYVEDQSIHCVNTCSVPFASGLDGSYHVYLLSGTVGHVVVS